MKIFLILIIAICQALIVIVPIKFKLVDNRRSFPKDLTKQGKFLIFLCALTVVCSVKLFQVSEKEESASKRELESGLQKRDSLYEVRLKQLNDSYTKKVDSSYKKSEETFLTITAKYGLHYDSLNNRLEKKIDTNRVEIQPDITLLKESGIALDSVTNSNKYYFSISTIAYDAAARNINIKLFYIAINSVGHMQLLDPIEGRRIKKSLSKNEGSKHFVTFTSRDINGFYILVKGTYTNIEGNKVHEIDNLYSYSFRSPSVKKYGSPGEQLDKSIRNFLQERSVLY